jgi:hypothetical protein
MAGETIIYDGSSTAVLREDPIYPFNYPPALYPDELSGNHVTVSGDTVGITYGGINTGTDNVTGNRVVITGNAKSDFVYGGYATDGSAAGNSVTMNGGTASNVTGGYSGIQGYLAGAKAWVQTFS